ncbi:MAG: hypothetical protein HY519_01155 [Candidatus Aenigmarchaeota archaeon]|nr:hypothetical protein [Candidatus Aenigmarchaeota archaeon]
MDNLNRNLVRRWRVAIFALAVAGVAWYASFSMTMEMMPLFALALPAGAALGVAVGVVVIAISGLLYVERHQLQPVPRKQMANLRQAMKSASHRFKTPVPFLYLADRPDLFVASVIAVPFRAKVMVSQKVGAALNQDELDAIAVHEAAYLVHRDYLLDWLLNSAKAAVLGTFVAYVLVVLTYVTVAPALAIDEKTFAFGAFACAVLAVGYYVLARAHQRVKGLNDAAADLFCVKNGHGQQLASVLGKLGESAYGAALNERILNLKQTVKQAGKRQGA